MNPFIRLPTELIQDIAYLLPTNTDIVRFASCSSDLAAKILPAESHIWRRLFRDFYDDVRRRSLVEYKIEYQVRTIVLTRPISLGHGQKEKETFWLNLMMDVIMEALVPSDMETDTGHEQKNLVRIREALTDTEFLNRPVSGYLMRKPDPPSTLFCAVQLTLTFMALDPAMSIRCLRTDYDIGAVYNCPGTEKVLFHEGFSVSVETALDIRNFWLRHLLNPDEATFYSSYMSLPGYHRPGPPERSTYKKPPRISSSWLGFESCICPLPATIPDLELRQTCADLNGHMVEVEHITLELEQHLDTENWPELFQECISHLSEEPTRFRGTMTYHGSASDRSVTLRGFLEEVYGGGEGVVWRRICFAAYERPQHLLSSTGSGVNGNGGQQGMSRFDEPWPPLDMAAEFTSIYAYEGVIIPGESLMIGQWWDARTELSAGPFIFWCV
ncbi:hypothetical protein BJX61DRAFT_546993 [Aspergillus egyptiacus]|nr:hypothetical protein BJX61DRAFT_546993 [Aspergillus egyptiacus]